MASCLSLRRKNLPVLAIKTHPCLPRGKPAIGSKPVSCAEVRRFIEKIRIGAAIDFLGAGFSKMPADCLKVGCALPDVGIRGVSLFDTIEFIPWIGETE